MNWRYFRHRSFLADCGIVPDGLSPNIWSNGRTTPHYDYFECPHRNNEWHRKVVDIRLFARNVPSEAIVKMMREEVDSILLGKTSIENSCCEDNAYSDLLADDLEEI